MKRSHSHDVLTIGRCGIDIYPLQSGIGLEHVSTFGKFLGGSPTNVAIAASRLGRNSAILTAVGEDPFGRFAIEEMRRLGVCSKHVATIANSKTPVTFCEIFPPNDFPLYFYRSSDTPDLQLEVSNIPEDIVRAAKIFWLSPLGMIEEKSRKAHLKALEIRKKYRTSEQLTILDLDYRPSLWESPEEAAYWSRFLLQYSDIAVGNLEECILSTDVKEAKNVGYALLELGPKIAIVKQGSYGCLGIEKHKTKIEHFFIPARDVKVINGLGAGDAFGGMLCHGLLSKWPLRKIVTYASLSGAIVAGRLECSTAMPFMNEIEHYLHMGIFPDTLK